LSRFYIYNYINMIRIYKLLKYKKEKLL